jgi:hypothetical protein
MTVGKGSSFPDNESGAAADDADGGDSTATALGAAVDDGVSVPLPSDVLVELERVTDYLISMSRGDRTPGALSVVAECCSFVL